MDAFPAGGALTFERSARIKLGAHPANASAMALKQMRRIINCLTFMCAMRVNVFTETFYSGKVSRFYRIVRQASCGCSGTKSGSGLRHSYGSRLFGSRHIARRCADATLTFILGITRQQPDPAARCTRSWHTINTCDFGCHDMRDFRPAQKRVESRSAGCPA